MMAETKVITRSHHHGSQHWSNFVHVFRGVEKQGLIFRQVHAMMMMMMMIKNLVFFSLIFVVGFSHSMDFFGGVFDKIKT